MAMLNGTVEDTKVSIDYLNGTSYPTASAMDDINMMNGQASAAATTPIAIIGLSCRFPGDATSPDKFWELVSEGRGAWSEIPKDRFNAASFQHPEPSKIGGTNVWGGHFLKDDVSLFDASFFNLSAEVAASMDPQTRLQLETVFEAAEDAGITLSQLAGSQTSVFAALWVREYHDSMMRRPESLPRYYLTGNGGAMSSNRISHFFDLKGASVTIDTACSSSLTALHLACQSLRTGDSTMSIVGGVNLILNPDMFIALSTLGMAGPQGRSYSFDQRAEGFGRGEGVAALLLKPLEDALRDGDPIRAIIRETALNQDGRTPTITSPSQEAQEELIRTCYKRAGLNPLDTAYVETHGTGTMVGDSIEAGAIGEVLGKGRPADKPLLIGSVKSNIGHLEAASGLAAVVKVVLALENGFIPPNYNFVKESEKIPFRDLGIRVAAELQQWPAQLPRRASINSFGYGGTNSHVIMEAAEYHIPGTNGSNLKGSELKSSGFSTNGLQALVDDGSQAHDSTVSESSINRSAIHEPSAITPGIDGSYLPRDGVNGSFDKPTLNRFIFPISARDETGVKTMMSRLKEFLLGKGRNCDLRSLAYTLTEKRERFPWTATPQAADIEELIESLGSSDLEPALSRAAPKLGFVFNGQGAQWFAMGRELMGAYPVFDQCLDEADSHLQSFGCEWSLREELCRDKQTSRVNETQLSIPLCVALQVALVVLLESWNIKPTAVTGHSSGEISAAFAAGALSIRSAMAASYFRGLITARDLVADNSVSGSMIAVGLGPEAVQPYLDSTKSGKVVIACVNSPASVTLSGDTAGVEELEVLFKTNEVFARKLVVPVAYHSHHMDRLAEKYQAALETNMQVNSTLNNVMFASPVTGSSISESKALGPAHWVKNMLQPVLFAQSFHCMCIKESTSEAGSKGATRNIDIVVEIGPHGTLAGPIRQCLSASGSLKDQGIGYASCLTRGVDAIQTMQGLAVTLLDKGYRVGLRAINFPKGAHNVSVLRLPSYAWNHSTSLWLEPRQNRDYRLRKHATHDLLGVIVPECNPSAPSWIHQIRLSEIPWVRDHVVDNEIVYPAAGMIAMVIEGLRQISDEQERIEGYFIHDVELPNAAIVPDSPQGLELRLFLDDVDDKSLRGDCREFTIFAVPQQGDWIECCKGVIRAQTTRDSRASNVADSEPEGEEVQSDKFFEQLEKVNLRYGKTFQHLDKIRRNQGRSSVMFHVADSASTMPRGFQSNHVIHPITLDSVLQAAFTVISDEQGNAMGGSVPRSIQSMYVSTNISTSPGHRFVARNRLLDADSKGFKASMAVSDVDATCDALPVVLEVTNIRYQALGRSPSSSNLESNNNLCLRTEWIHDVSIIGTESYKQSLQSKISQEEVLLLEDLKRASAYLIHDILQSLTQEDIDQLEWHHKVMYEWLLYQQDLAAKNEIAPRSSIWARAKPGIKQRLWDQVAAASVNGEMLVRIGKNLLGIMRKQITPLELMMEGKLLYRYYENMLRMDRSLNQAEQIVRTFSHACPRPRVLEIGGGTGSATGPTLRAMSSSDDGISEPRLSRYDFTDISSGFLEAAHDKFASWAHLMTFKTLNIENDPEQQGFELASYDLIIACQVLHATKDMTHTLTNVWKLLKPGGKLIMIETTQDAVDVQLVFGTVPGWWLSTEPERRYSPNMPVSMWSDILGRTGFSGVDLAVNDCEDERSYGISVIVSTALPTAPADYPPSVALVHGQTTPPEKWLASLRSSIQSKTGVEPSVASLGQFVPDGTVAIFLAETEAPILDRIDPPTFDAIKRMLNDSKGCLWLSRGASVKSALPERALHIGLLRTRRLEDTAKRYAALDLDTKDPVWSDPSIHHIADYFAKAFNYAVEKSAIDFEVAVRGDDILLPRITPDSLESMDSQPNSNVNHFNPELQLFGASSDHALRLDIRIPGCLDSIAFVDDETPGESLDDGFIEVETMVFGVNSRDAIFATEKTRDTPIGFECSGIVTRVGPVGSASDKNAHNPHELKVGDRVCGFSTGRERLGHKVRMHYSTMVKIPDDMSFEAGASIPIAFVTAYYSVLEKAGLGKHERILIHSAAGGVGQAAIMLAQSVGAEVFVTAGSQEKQDLLRSVYGIQQDHIFSSKDASFAAGVMVATKGFGVDVVLNTLSGELLHVSCEVMAPLGRLVDISKHDVQRNKRMEMKLFDNAKSFIAVDIAKVTELQNRVVHRTLRKCIDLLEAKQVHSVQPLHVYPMSEVVRAFQAVQDGKHTGKILVSTGPENIVPVLPARKAVKLQPDVSYLLAGGLGGIGRSLVKWFVAQGAKNILILSRTAASRTDSGDLMKEMEGQGCRVVIKNCDIAVADDLGRALEESYSEIPFVKGVIQAAMVLNDSVFEHMDHKQWCDATRPKVLGTRNLHNLFGDDLDFFVMLSSLTGVLGNASQGNYAAGGSFQDAFASWRTSQGLPAVSIDLGTVKSIGYVAETEGVAARMQRAGYVPQEEEEVLRLVEAAIQTPFRQFSSRQSQVITGIGVYDDVGDIAWRKERRFANLLRASPTGVRAETSGLTSNGGDRERLADLVSKAKTLAEVTNIVADGIAVKLADMFMLPVEEIDESQGLAKHGVDSLVAVELRTWLSSRIQTEISIFDMLQSGSLMAVAEKAAIRSQLVIKARLVGIPESLEY